MMVGLRLDMLGGVHISRDGHGLTDALPLKGRALLCFLALERREHARSTLAALLWSESSEADAATSLRQVLTQLRRELGAHLRITRHTVAFNAEHPFWLDVDAFESHIAAAAEHDLARLRQAVSFYRGDFLTGLAVRDAPAFEEWLVLERERLRILALNALTTLVRAGFVQGDYATCMADAVHLLTLDPWREEAHRQLIWLYIRTGQHSAALAQFHTCRQILARELGIDPAPETQALFERIVNARARPNRALPTPAHRLVGRQQEQALLRRWMADPSVRLVTLVGPGGIGKTRLAQQVALEWHEHFLEGAALVSMASIAEGDALVLAVVAAVGCPLHSSQQVEAQLRAFLADKDMLLIFDNAEHLQSSCADLVSAILDGAPGVKLLVTSRERLRLQPEQLITLGGLETPPQAAADVEAWSAAELFVQAARRLRPDFVLSGQDAEAVAQVCHLVEGVPLGIELAAAWTRLLSCAQIADEVQQSLAFLATSLRDAPARHQSLSSVVDHSWRLLAPDERIVLSRLAVFRGGFSHAAAREVAGAASTTLRMLVDQSLIRAETLAQAEPRLYLHEMIRQYAWERLDGEGGLAETQDRHLWYYVQFAELAAPHLQGEQQEHWFAGLDRERDNIRAALAWSLAPDRSVQQAEWGARLCVALWRFWWLRNNVAEGRRWLEASLGDERIALAVRASAFHGAGVLAQEHGHLARARACYEHSLALRRDLGDQRGIAASLNSLGVVAMDEGRFEQARALYQESLELKRVLGDRRGIAYSLGNLGLAASARGQYAQALSYYRESLDGCRALGDRFGESVALGNLGAAALELGDIPAAAAWFMQALPLFQAIGDSDGIAECFEGLAGVANARQQFAAAARLAGASQALRAAIGVPMTATECRRFESILESMQAGLAPGDYAAALAGGRAMQIGEAIQLAHQVAAQCGLDAFVG